MFTKMVEKSLFAIRLRFKKLAPVFWFYEAHPYFHVKMNYHQKSLGYLGTWGGRSTCYAQHRLEQDTQTKLHFII